MTANTPDQMDKIINSIKEPGDVIKIKGDFKVTPNKITHIGSENIKIDGGFTVTPNIIKSIDHSQIFGEGGTDVVAAVSYSLKDVGEKSTSFTAHTPEHNMNKEISDTIARVRDKYQDDNKVTVLQIKK